MNQVINNKIVKTKNQLQEAGNTRVEQGRAQQIRSTEIKSNDNNNSLSIYNRELMALDSKMTGYVESVNKAIKLRVNVNLEIVNEVLSKNKKELIVYNQKESILDLGSKALKGCLAISKYGLRSEYQKLASCTRKNIIDFKAGRLMGISHEAHINGIFCWKVLLKVLEGQEINFPKFQINNNKQEKDIVFIQGINSTIRKTCTELKNIKETVFCVFRKLLDPSLKIESKEDIMIEFNPKFGAISQLGGPSGSQDINKEFAVLLDMVNLFTGTLSDEIYQLHHMIEVLDLFKRAPKTLENSREVYQVLQKCYGTYKTVLNHTGFEKNPYLENRLKIKQLLRDLLLTMAKPINEATIENNKLNQKLESSKQNTIVVQKEIVSKNTQSKKIENRKVISNNVNKGRLDILKKHETESAKKDVKPNEVLKQDSIIISEDPKDKMIIQSHEEIKKELILPQKEEIKAAYNNNVIEDVIIDEVNLEDDSFEDFEQETNDLMEVLRRCYETDRAEKLKIQEEKKMKSKKIIEAYEDPKKIIASNKIIPIVHILSDKKQILVKNLFRKPLPDYRIILGKKVQSLITQLGGKSQGNKGNFEIYWNGSNKKAGDYEICHEGDTKGYLTPNYAKRVADAIYAGVMSYRTISKGYFTQELLQIIENYEVN